MRFKKQCVLSRRLLSAVEFTLLVGDDLGELLPQLAVVCHRKVTLEPFPSTADLVHGDVRRFLLIVDDINGICDQVVVMRLA